MKHWLMAVRTTWPRFFLLINRRLLSCHMWFLYWTRKTKNWKPGSVTSSSGSQLHMNPLHSSKLFVPPPPLPLRLVPSCLPLERMTTCKWIVISDSSVRVFAQDATDISLCCDVMLNFTEQNLVYRISILSEGTKLRNPFWQFRNVKQEWNRERVKGRTAKLASGFLVSSWSSSIDWGQASACLLLEKYEIFLSSSQKKKVISERREEIS